MALSCQTQLFCVIDCIRDSSVSRVDSVVSGAINFCSAMYAGVGLFGYVAFFSRTLHGDVLVELESSFFTQSSRQYLRYGMGSGAYILPIVCMALSCQTQLFCVIDCIRDSSVSRVDSVVSGAINFCSAMYAGVGLFGYVAFFSRTLHGDVLVELESSFFTQLLKLAFLLSIAVSVPLMLFPARIALFNLVLRPSNCELPVSNAMRYSTFHVLTFVILLFNLTIALLIPNVEFILGLTGSLIGSLVCIVIPSILYIAVTKNKEHYSVSYAKVLTVIIIGSSRFNSTD
ncbi:hypothetical protein ANCDUO_17520 [Ancylostoma duodenale]|uniref:Amino acid transporter transmembrane domain-containing protein n=1 Tax=Ancylostoma duodenale TaxID=51022 RepID=A0A0C2G0F8_9BILA|nr:hypothetical protein ANCDUO_17520 [Ancylostoma duodenale]